MKLRSILGLSLIVLAPVAGAQSVDQLFVRAALHESSAAAKIAVEDKAEHENFAPAYQNTKSVAEDLDTFLQQRFDRDGDIPRPSEALLVSAN
ncbi:hypothetical protein H2508_11915 [Parahaliea sp. F7430]|uniref:Uncharacterized protein n=1 Tax=Sediminihaliea albiluteola TaxID=2758564 RepID=A0A7W2TXL4_9GAMM|nr:hypothetical protein [Sediminihaliea albiluteola]MBA6413817.1 hypothetical protein [Sediminihaliea albiluteola]